MSTAEKARWFSEHVHPHEPALRAYLAKRFPALPDHDDLVQETYARILRVDDPDRLVHPKAFLFTTARNAAIDLFRRRQAHPHDALAEAEGLIELPLLDAPPSVTETLERRQRREVLTEALRALPERCREVMLLRYLDGCSGKEIAARLGISLGTVKGHLLKGVRDCARFFESRGLVDAAPDREPSP
jgi:RNA polymerase sigma-70 factor (ECF subfamily)